MFGPILGSRYMFCKIISSGVNASMANAHSVILCSLKCDVFLSNGAKNGEEKPKLVPFSEKGCFHRCFVLSYI